MKFPLVLVLLGFCACADHPEVKKGSLASAWNGEYEGAPDWVSKGCGAFFGEKKHVICGVGIIGGTRNIAMARESARARGRTEIARTLNLRVKSMLKDYMNTVTGGEEFGQKANDEQYVTSVSKQITDITLPGTVEQDTWISHNGNAYSLVVLDVDGFIGSLGQLKQLDERIRKAVEQRAGKAFEELDKETEGPRTPRRRGPTAAGEAEDEAGSEPGDEASQEQGP